ncbi:MAG TPA: DivIVA domain-containing protein [Candidatus Saccharimonadales bacterium]|nr:DivIVA domain-containing protein [Candidatus Saccharimonadales bacterium]
MRITPLDIKAHEFKRKLRGFDPEEVQAFLEIVAEEYERFALSNAHLTDEMAELTGRLAELRERERILKETLYSAQKLAEEMRQEARRERELILKEAELKAEQLIDTARRRVSQLESEILDLKAERDAFESKVRSMIEQHTKLLDMRKEQEDVSTRLRFIKRRERGGTNA